jgi:hypothetical protein
MFQLPALFLPIDGSSEIGLISSNKYSDLPPPTFLGAVRVDLKPAHHRDHDQVGNFFFKF